MTLRDSPEEMRIQKRTWRNLSTASLLSSNHHLNHDVKIIMFSVLKLANRPESKRSDTQTFTETGINRKWVYTFSHSLLCHIWS